MIDICVLDIDGGIRAVEHLPDNQLRPGVIWWQGPTACSVCGWRGRHVAPMPNGNQLPVIPLPCPNCLNATATPDV